MTDNISSNASTASRDDGASGAFFKLRGTLPRNATISEYFYFYENGAYMAVADLDWKMTFRADLEQDNADFTLSTDDATLVTTTDNDGNPVLHMTVAVGTFSNARGDYTTDLASKDSNDTVVLWAHGITSFTRNPVTWS